MTGLMTIELRQLRFHAYHGLYAEEKRMGNEFEINLTVAYAPSGGIITDLHDTVNYVSVYELLNTEMQKPRELLETFIMEMTDLIHSSFPMIRKVEIELIKLYPPIALFTGKVGVKYSKEYL